MVITGDMQSVNKINFAIFRWFGPEFRPRFANLKLELKHIYCGKDPSHSIPVTFQEVCFKA